MPLELQPAVGSGPDPSPAQQSAQGVHAGEAGPQVGSAGGGCGPGRAGPGLRGGEGRLSPCRDLHREDPSGKGRAWLRWCLSPRERGYPADTSRDAVLCCLRSRWTDQIQQVPLYPCYPAQRPSPHFPACFTSCDGNSFLLVERWLLRFQPFHQETRLSGQLWVMSTSEPTAVGVRSRRGRCSLGGS